MINRKMQFIQLANMDLNHQELFLKSFPGINEFKGCVVVCGHYRSGTTALSNLISAYKGIPNLSEILDINHDGTREEALELLQRGEHFVFSIKPEQYSLLPKQFIRGDIPLYKIKITRSGIVDLLASSVLSQLDTGQYDTRYPIPPHSVAVDRSIIRNHIYTFLTWRSTHTLAQFEFNADVYYEEIKELFKYSNTEISWKPTNYIELKEVIKEEYEKILVNIDKRNKWCNDLS